MWIFLSWSCAAAPGADDTVRPPPGSPATPLTQAATAEPAPETPPADPALWSTALTDLEPGFRARVERLLTRLRARGHDPVVGTTWRDPRAQDLLYALGGSTKAAGGKSCHNKVDAAGRPAARAIDLWSAPVDPGLVLGLPDRLAQEVPFLRDLGDLARAEGLRWGGDWRGRESVWSAHGLGWDPAHVELGRCG
jgi:peptidoglycan L-alanyl-D-glutamate endopeptidase CwlK